MKFLPLVLAFLVSGAYAFDSEDWLGKRALLDREAERLQSAFTDFDKKVVEPAENITIPIENYPDGAIKASVTAKRAQFFLDKGFVWAADVTLRQFAKDGQPDAEVTAEKCLVDRTTKSAWVEGHASAKYHQTELEGDGIYFSFPEEFVRISTNTEIRIKDLKLKNREIATAKPVVGDARVSSVRADYDHKEGVLMFDRDVQVSNPEYQLSGEQLYVFLNGTNELKRIVASGNVKVVNGDRTGSCSKVLYVRSDSRVTMFGEGADRPAKLADNGKNKSEVEGRKITFWMDSEQVEVEGSTITLDSALWGDKGGMKDILGK